MNILYLPSWWPSKNHPFAGIFFKEQIERLAVLNPEHKFYIFYWGSSELELKPNKIFRTLVNFLNFSSLPRRPKTLPNLIFISSPLITLPRKFFGTAVQNYFVEKILRKKLLGIRVDLIHAMVGQPGGVVAHSLSLRWNIPYLITEVMGPFPFPHLREKNGEIWQPLLEAYHSSSVNIADGQVKLKTMQAEGINNSIYIPNFLNEDLFKVKNASLISDKNVFKFFTLSGLVEGKGYDTLLDAISLLEDKDRYSFTIGGGGPLELVLKGKAKDLGIDHLIKWIGQLDRADSIREYQACDAFILPSRHESFGIVYVEALFCGKPIIATRCGGPQEFVTDLTGLICDVDNSEQLKDAMTHLRNNIQQYDASNIRNWAMSRYSSGIVCSKIIDRYSEILSGLPSQQVLKNSP